MRIGGLNKDCMTPIFALKSKYGTDSFSVEICLTKF